MRSLKWLRGWGEIAIQRHTLLYNCTHGLLSLDRSYKWAAKHLSVGSFLLFFHNHWRCKWTTNLQNARQQEKRELWQPTNLPQMCQAPQICYNHWWDECRREGRWGRVGIAGTGSRRLGLREKHHFTCGPVFDFSSWPPVPLFPVVPSDPQPSWQEFPNDRRHLDFRCIPQHMRSTGFSESSKHSPFPTTLCSSPGNLHRITKSSQRRKKPFNQSNNQSTSIYWAPTMFQ